LVPRQDIDGALFLKIKKLMVSSEVGSAVQLHRIANAVGTLLEPILQTTRSPSRRPAKLSDWEVRAEAWNRYIEPALQHALLYHCQQERSLVCPTTCNNTTHKKGKKKPPPTPTKPSQPSPRLPPPKPTTITVTPEALDPTESN
jgi:hypothetical protein